MIKLPFDTLSLRYFGQNSKVKFNQLNTRFELINIDDVAKKSTTPIAGEHLSYHEFLPQTMQSIEPCLWLGNMPREHFNAMTSYVPPANLYEFHEVYLAAQGCIIDKQQRVFLSQRLQMDVNHLKAGRVNPFLINSSNSVGKSISFEKVLTVRKIEDVPCIPLSQPGEHIYGHWLVDILPRVVFAQELNIKVKYISTIYLPDYARKLLQLLGVKNEDIVIYNPKTEAVFMKHCYYPGHLRQNSAFSALATKLSERFIPYRSQCKKRKLFMSRGKFNKRQSIANAPALHEFLVRHGIEIIEPHKYSIEEQIKLFSEADFIMGEYGSAMHSSFFAHPNTKVIVLQSDRPLPFVQAGIGALLNQPTGFVFGENLQQNNRFGRSFYAPLDSVKQALELM